MNRKSARVTAAAIASVLCVFIVIVPLSLTACSGHHVIGLALIIEQACYSSTPWPISKLREYNLML